MAERIASEILDVHAGARDGPCSCALILIGLASPGTPPGELAALSVGECNARLLALYRDTFGPVMHAFATCPRCAEPCALDLPIQNLLEGYAPPSQREFDLASGHHAARYRLLTIEDFTQVEIERDELSARLGLARRALLSISHGAAWPSPAEASADFAEASADFIDLLFQDMSERDPLADIQIPLACAVCVHVWAATLHILSFFLAELKQQADALPDEMRELARPYHGSETAILAIGANRGLKDVRPVRKLRHKPVEKRKRPSR